MAVDSFLASQFLVAVTALSAVLGAIVGAFLLLRIVRRQRMHESKQGAYESLIPPIQESIVILGAMQELDTLEISDDDRFVANLLTLIAGLAYFGDREGWDTLSEIQAVADEADEEREESEEEETEEDRQQFLEDVKESVTGALAFQLSKNRSELRRLGAVLSFARPNQQVSEGLAKVDSMFTSDLMGFGLRRIHREAGLKGLLPDVDLRERGETFSKAFDELRQAMEDDLRRTL